jgi:molecular chaperone GrpE (heat shock protein)
MTKLPCLDCSKQGHIKPIGGGQVLKTHQNSELHKQCVKTNKLEEKLLTLGETTDEKKNETDLEEKVIELTTELLKIKKEYSQKIIELEKKNKQLILTFETIEKDRKKKLAESLEGITDEIKSATTIIKSDNKIEPDELARIHLYSLSRYLRGREGVIMFMETIEDKRDLYKDEIMNIVTCHYNNQKLILSGKEQEKNQKIYEEIEAYFEDIDISYSESDYSDSDSEYEE